jgi:hypothetical protein
LAGTTISISDFRANGRHHAGWASGFNNSPRRSPSIVYVELISKPLRRRRKISDPERPVDLLASISMLGYEQVMRGAII